MTKFTEIQKLENEKLRSYYHNYLTREVIFEQSIEKFGLPLEDGESFPRENRNNLLRKCQEKHTAIKGRNANYSLYRGWISPACEACRKGLATITYSLTLDCPHNCYFCFNPNQDNFESDKSQVRDIEQDLREVHKRGAHFDHIAITGGEPTLYFQDLLDFIELAKRLYPHVRVRLYTSGDLLTDNMLQQLSQKGLDEIRFSIKLEKPGEFTDRVLGIMKSALDFIEDVVVEMPVAPDQEVEMQSLLLKLDDLGIRGINLLELGFPFTNSEAFRSRGFRIRKNPFDALYEYWYAGGVPIAQSEEVCLRLLEYAEAKNLSLGVQYCSLDNKNTSQVFQQNYFMKKHFHFCHFSETDFLLRSIKVFGADAKNLFASLTQKGFSEIDFDEAREQLEFNPELVSHIPPKFQDVEVLVCSYIVEAEPEKRKVLLKEVKVEPHLIKDL